MNDKSDLRQLLLDMVARRGPTKSICPSEVARAAAPQHWRELMPSVRAVAIELAAEGRIEFLQRGESVDPLTARGPVRLRGTNQPSNASLDSVRTVAIIGAGISGLACAHSLVEHGLAVTIFEKSRGVGGRMATRRTATGLRFDHGAQYFTVRDERFEQRVQTWLRDGIVAPWEGRIVTLNRGHFEEKTSDLERFVGVPAMNAVCKHLAEQLRIQLKTQVAPPRHEHGIWTLSNDGGSVLGEFDYVITSAPAPQAAALLTSASGLQQHAEAVLMSGCWAAMIAFDTPRKLPFDAAFVHDSPLSWVARNDSKPQRHETSQHSQGRPDSWVLHASPVWTDDHLEDDPADVLAQLIAAFWEAVGEAPTATSHAAAHRWRFAIPPEPLADRCLFDPLLQVGACGDWCGGPRVEGAFLSGLAMAERVVSHFEAERS